ncbi:Putative HLH-domain-containing protein [Rhizopus microsporus]|nr:Putative HLH-domain-containing protein [Rhizopus microsporus]
MDIHRRSSSNMTDLSHGRQDVVFNNNNHHPVFMPSSSLESTHSLAMSAPANVGYDFAFQPTTTTSTGHIPSSSSNNSIPRSFEDDYAAQMNMQIMMEKRRRRRESHNAVERRRRDNINDRIQELCSLLPENALENATLGPNNKPNKGIILKKSVEHMRQLQQQVQDYHQKIQDLEKTLNELCLHQDRL